jgi:transcriptional regulator with XRE-family HTH domain
MSQQENSNEQHWQLLVLILKEVADAKKITQEQIALETGLQQSSVSRFFSLKWNPQLGTYLKIAKALKMNIFFEDQESTTELNLIFEKAMESLGRRTDKLPKN